MCRSTLITLAAFCIAVVAYGLTCDESLVGITFAMDDPLGYYTCHDANTVMAFPCVDGSGYINNGTLRGCVPWVLWDCTSKSGPPACTAAELEQKFPHVDPTMYWICQSVNTSLALSCPTGQAYYNLQCQDWADWWEACPW